MTQPKAPQPDEVVAIALHATLPGDRLPRLPDLLDAVREAARQVDEQTWQQAWRISAATRDEPE